MEGQSVVSDKQKFVEIRTKFRVSNEHVDVSSIKLVTCANEQGLILVGSKDKSIKAITSDQVLVPNKNTGQYVYSFQLTFIPTILSVSRLGYSSILLSSGYNETSNCPVVELFDLVDRSSIGKVELGDLSGVRIIDYAWHTTYYESIVALCTDKGHLLVIGFSRKDKRAALVYKDQQYGALTCCWSPKGKNLAIGMSNGKIIRLEPVITASSFTFKEVKNSTLTFEHNKISPQHQIIKIRWIVKTTIICVHALPSAPSSSAVYSITTIKPGKPYSYWTSLCFEKNEPNYNVQLVNLTSSVICCPSSASEAAVLSVDSNEEAKISEPTNWNSIVIDEEGGRIELPLDENNRETFPRGVTVAFSKNNPEIGNRPILVFYTSEGLLCPFAAFHSNNILKLSEMQQLEECPLSIPKTEIIAPNIQNVRPATMTSTFGSLDLRTTTSSFGSLDMRPVSNTVLAPKPLDNSVKETNNVSLDLSIAPTMKEIEDGIKKIKRGMEFDAMFLLNEINHLRGQFDEIEDIHKSHKEALSAIKADIESLDLGMLENLYLIEYIKSRNKGPSRKKSLNPRVLEKVEAIKQKSKNISGKLRDLNAHVDLSWEDYVRRRKSMEYRDRRLNSLDIIYQTLANNQKIINYLKKKSEGLSKLPPAPVPTQDSCDFARIELNPVRMRALREFLGSRVTVPVRRPAGEQLPLGRRRR